MTLSKMLLIPKCAKLLLPNCYAFSKFGNCYVFKKFEKRHNAIKLNMRFRECHFAFLTEYNYATLDHKANKALVLIFYKIARLTSLEKY